MEQAASSSSPPPARENSAQNPPTPSSSPTIEPHDVTTNGIKLEEALSTFSLTSPSAQETPVAVAVTASTEGANRSPLTNLSRHAITNEMVFGPIPDREYHEGFMRKAIEMAQLALDSDETPVGCVFVRDGEVIGRGINGTNASLNVSETFPSFLWL